MWAQEIGKTELEWGKAVKKTKEKWRREWVASRAGEVLATRVKQLPSWAASMGKTQVDWEEAEKKEHQRWARQFKASQRVKRPTRSAVLPDWARTADISCQEWVGATLEQRQRWRRHYMGADSDIGEDGSDDDGHVVSGSRVYFGEYVFEDLDLSLAQEAQGLHDWDDAHCVQQLMLLLTEGRGRLRFRGYFAKSLHVGRLYLEWPTLLHVNKEFRALLLYRQAAMYSDLDMSNAHSNICQYLAQGVGVEIPALLEYIENRHALRKMLTDQSVKDGEAKKLWLSILNSGTLRGWLFVLKKKMPHLEVKIPMALKKHCLALQEQVLVVRTLMLQKSPWKEMHQDIVTAHNNNVGKRRSDEQLKRSAWNCVLCTVETEVVSALGRHIEQRSTARVCMPSYDGVLLRHPENGFDWDDELSSEWQELCLAKWGFVFPVERKNYLDHMPKWMLEILRLRALH